jgi:hypothetical protein
MSEQDRADLLAQAIESLMAGETVASDDPLLQIARNLANVRPSDQVIARFDQQVDRWFPPPSPAPARPAIPLRPIVIIGIVIVVIVLVIIGLIISRPVIAPTPSPLPSATQTTAPTATASVTATVTSTTTQTATTSASATASPTDLPTNTTAPTATQPAVAIPVSTNTVTPSPVPPTATNAGSTVQDSNNAITPAPSVVTAAATYTRVIIVGQIEQIQNGVIIILGQTIRITGTVGGLCSGDLVRIEATVNPDGTLSASRTALTVETSGCTAQAPTGGGSAPSGGNSGGGNSGGSGDSGMGMGMGD